jgi:sugar lactone lactonase YvrE
MILLTSMLRRLPHLTHDEFVAYHRDHHAPLFASTPAAQKYLRRYTVEHPNPTRAPGLPPSTFEAIVRMTFDDKADLIKLFTSRSYLETIRPDEKRFFDYATSEFFLSEEFVVIGDERTEPLTIVAPTLSERENAPRSRKLDPVRWTPPKARDAPSSTMVGLRIFPTSGFGAEDVAVRPDGTVVTGFADGRIVALDPETGVEQPLAHTGGRPLGIENHPDGGLVVCDSDLGLLYVSPTGIVDRWASGFEGEPFKFCNNAAVASDGTVYFSDSSRRWRVEDWLGDVFEHRPSGRLFRRTPGGNLDLLADGLGFANGVALAPDESFLVVAETISYTLQRIELSGPDAGQKSQFAETLPSFPDNISTGTDGNIWVALVAPRVPILDFMLPKHPRWRKLVWSLPDGMTPTGKKPLDVRAYDTDGLLVHNFHAEHPGFGNATGARQVEDHVWLGSIEHAAVARFDLP